MDDPRMNPKVTGFLDELNHPLRDLIESLRDIILGTGLGLQEGIKWNAPSYSLDGEDCITLKINPPKQIQIVFHRGAKVKEQPKERLLKDEYSLLEWKAKDRAIASFKSTAELEEHRAVVEEIVAKWIEAVKE